MNDLISRQETRNALDIMCDVICPYTKKQRDIMCGACGMGSAIDVVEDQPSVQPYTEDEIQKIQDLEQAQLDKMYELGKQSAQPERIRGRWSGFYSEPNDDTHIYGEKLMEGDTVYLLGVEGYVSYECGAWGWGSPNYVPWEQLESRMPHNNAPTFCYCDNFISFWELKWNFDDGNDWDGVPYVKHYPNCGADMRGTDDPNRL